MGRCKAKDYRPEWVLHQLTDYGIEPTPDQAMVLDRMIAEAGEFMGRRQRWILRQIRMKPMSATALLKPAIKAAEIGTTNMSTAASP